MELPKIQNRVGQTTKKYKNMIEWYKKVVLENYANFNGRARRSEYWWFALMNALILLFFGILIGVSISMENDILMYVFVTLFVIYFLATIIPNIAVTVRRLHDINKSGWYYLVSFIPYVGGIWILILTCTNGTVGLNNYGHDPKQPESEINQIGEE